MIANTYSSLKTNRDKQRKELEQQSPVPGHLHGELMPKLLSKFSQEKIFQEGTMAWTRVSMSTIISATDALGWERFINLLDKVQRPANYRRAKQLIEKYNIPNEPAGAWDLLMLWAQGCLFEGYSGQRTGLKGIKDGAGDMADFCPQVAALKDMGMLHRAGELQTWCEAYDNLVMHALDPDSYFTYLQCLAKEGESCCITYIKSEKSVKGKNYYQKVKGLQEERRARRDALIPRPYQYTQEYISRLLEKLDIPAVVRAKDGAFVKGRIAQDNIILSADAMGWEKFIDLIAKEQSPGFGHCANDLKSFLGIIGDDLRTAGLLLASSLYMMGYDSHHFIKVSDSGIEGAARQCNLIDSAKNLEMEGKVADLSLWCDFYHNHVVHAINPDYQLTHTHCLGRGDKCCRFVLE